MENNYIIQVIIFISTEGNYRIEDLIWDKELWKPVLTKVIMIKEAQNIPDWVDIDVVDKENIKKRSFVENSHGGIEKKTDRILQSNYQGKIKILRGARSSGDG